MRNKTMTVVTGNVVKTVDTTPTKKKHKYRKFRYGVTPRRHSIFVHNAANRLYNHMVLNNITCIELSEKTGINVQSIYNYYNGSSAPNLIPALKIAKALCCNVEDLWSVEDLGG